jgi:hypothetical protein
LIPPIWFHYILNTSYLPGIFPSLASFAFYPSLSHSRQFVKFVVEKPPHYGYCWDKDFQVEVI